MLKPKTTDIADSNIANYGSDEHRDLRKEVAESEMEYKDAGKEAGIEIWRIEDFGVKKWPKKQYGTFYQGDSYIVLNTYKDKEDSKKLKYNLHFWLGKHTTQDEYGSAAYKAVELDDLLDDCPVQYREVQGHESKEFKKLFPRMQLLQGGIDSAFNNVKPEEYKPRLLQVKGKTHVVVTQISLSSKILTAGDSYILDNGLKLYQWNGPESNHFERRKAMETINIIKEQRNGRPQHSVLDGLDDDDDEFWNLLGGKPEKLRPATSDKDIFPNIKKLYRISDASGKMKFSQEQSTSNNVLDLDKLDSNDIFLVDIGHTCYIWVGKNANNDERKAAMKIAHKYLNDNDRSMATSVVRVVEGGEPITFKNAFDGNRQESKENKNSDDDEDSLPSGFDGTLQFTVHEGKEFKDVQMLGKQDPYVSVSLRSSNARTPACEDGDDQADWNNHDIFVGIDKKDKLVNISVKNQNILVDKTIGQTKLSIDDAIRQGRQPKQQWLTIERDGEVSGMISVTIKYIPPLKVHILECKELEDVQSLGNMDPFVRVEFQSYHMKTNVAKDQNTTPKWSTDNIAKINAAAFTDKSLDVHFILINENMLKNDTIGSCYITLRDLLAKKGLPASWFPIQHGGGQIKLKID